MERDDQEGKMFTIKEAAARLRVSDKTIRNWIKSKKLRARHIGRPLYITEEDIQAALRDRESTRPDQE